MVAREWIMGWGGVRTGADGVGVEGFGAVLEALLVAVGEWLLAAAIGVVGLFGLWVDPGSEQGLWLAWGIVVVLLPVMLLLAWIVRQRILGVIRRLRPGEEAWAEFWKAVLRPLLLLLWLGFALVAFSPLLCRSLEQGAGWVVPVMRVLVVVIVVGALVWFGMRLVGLYERRLTLLKKDADRRVPFLIPVVLRSLRVVLPVSGFLIVQPVLMQREEWAEWTTYAFGILIILTVSWVIAQVIRSFPDWLLRKYDLHAADNLAARKIYTQVQVIQRIGLVLLGFLAFSSILLLFPVIRQFGQAILASAGVAGIVIGLALQRTLGNLFAGIQIAFTQPIRIDDVVIVENEWGWIEDITLTYVVVKIWDWRRLVLPISYFIERPFQNWTRTSASIIGTVFVRADYRLPIPAYREEVEKLVKAHPLWDGKVFVLQVTDCAEQTVELRVLVSAVDSPKAWDLRCDIREGMLTVLQTRYPECLPRIRIEGGAKAGEEGDDGTGWGERGQSPEKVTGGANRGGSR